MMTRLITFLGTGNYAETIYQWNNHRCTTCFVAEALADFFATQECFVLATDKAWEAHGDALRKRLEKRLRVQRCPIPDGQSEQELWQQFHMLREAISKKNPESVILDITHGFRAQPFFAAGVLAQLAACGQLPKEIRVVYGEFRRDGRTSPIWDLGLFVELLGWAQGTVLMRETGNGRMLVDILRREAGQQMRELARTGERNFPATGKLINAIKRFSDDLATARIASLITGYEQNDSRKPNARSSAHELWQALEQYRGEVEHWLPALLPLLERLKELAEGLHAQKLHSDAGLRAMQTLAQRYLSLGRFGEAATTLREGWISAYGTEAGAEVNSPDFSAQERTRAERDWQQKAGDLARGLAKVRNDIQHGGFNEQPLSASSLKEQIESWVQEFARIVPQPAGSDDPAGRTWFVTRHPGAVAWAGRRGIKVDRQVTHLDPEEVGQGDTVLGTLPVHLVHQLTRRGVRYGHLSLDMPEKLRGQELDADDLEACHARIQFFKVNADE